MSISNIAGGLAALYGGYKLMTAKEGSDKRNAMVALSVGVALLAVGFFSESAPDVILPLSDDVVTNCKLAQKVVLESQPENRVGEIISLARKHGYIDCEHFLPWTNDYYALDYIRSIPVEDMKDSVMWGIDPGRRPFFAIKYVCESALGKSQEAVVTLFQRYTDDLWSMGIHNSPNDSYQARRCMLMHRPAFREGMVEYLSDLMQNGYMTLIHSDSSFSNFSISG